MTYGGNIKDILAIKESELSLELIISERYAKILSEIPDEETEGGYRDIRIILENG